MATKAEFEAILRLRDELSAKVKGVQSTMERLEKTTKRNTTALQRAQKSLGGLQLKYVAAAAGMAVFIRAARGALEAQSKQEQAINSLNLALSNQGNLLPGTSKRLQEYASSLQRVTTFGDETILANQALLASFGMNEQQLKTSTKVALDFAAATGRDVKMAINLLGKAFVGETGELSRYGIIIDKNIPKSERFAEVMRQLEERFGGSAQAQVATFSGQMEQLSNAFGDTQEALGKFLGELASFGTGGQGGITMLESLTKFIGQDMVIALGEARALWSELAATIIRAVTTIIKQLTRLPKAMAAIYRKFEDLPLIGKLASGVAAGLEILPDLGLEAAEGLDAMADGLEASAKAFREESDAAAAAVGATLEFSNVTKKAENTIVDVLPVIDRFGDALKNIIPGVGAGIEKLPSLEIDRWTTTILNSFVSVRTETEKATEQTVTWQDSIADLAHAFSFLEGTAGESLGRIVGLMQVGRDAGQQIKAGLSQGGASGLASAAGGAVKGVGAFMAATEGGGLGGAIGGAVTGASIGSVVPGIGTAIGAIVGGIIGGLRGRTERRIAKEVGEAYGIGITKEMAKAIKEKGKELGVSEEIAQLLSLGEIVGVGGINAGNLGQVTEQFDALLQGIADGSIPAAAGLQSVSEGFAAMTVELQAMGIKGTFEIAELILEMKELGLVTADVQAFITETATAAVGNLGQFFAYLAEQEALTTKEAKAALTQMTGAFAAAVEATGSLAGAIQMLGPSFGDLIKKLRGTIGEDNPMLNQLSQFYNFITNNGEQLSAIQALSDAFFQLAEIGIVNKGNITEFAQSSIIEMQKLLAATGDQKSALIAMGPQIAMLVEAFRAAGVDIPPELKAIADAAVEAGASLEPPKGAVDILSQIEKILLSIADALGAVTDGANTAGTALSDIDLGNGNGNGGGHSGGGKPPIGAASGMFERLNKDTLILAHAGELAAIVPKHLAGTGGAFAFRTARRGIPDRDRPGGGGRAGGGANLPGGDALAGLPPDVVNDLLSGELGGGATKQTSLQKQMVSSMVAEIAAAVKPDVNVAAPSNINVTLPEISTRQAGLVFEDETLPRIITAIRNNKKQIMSAIKEQL